MAVDPHKKRVVFLSYDEIMNLVTLAEMHYNAKGAPVPLQRIPVSQEWVESLQSSVKALNKVLEDVWEAEKD
jgi:hypothetical protein